MDDAIFYKLLQTEELPEMYKVHYTPEVFTIADPARTVQDAIAARDVFSPIRPGDSVAIATGSREVENIALIVRTVVEEVKRHGGAPFVVPAMGSHGGATAEGQRKILEGFGITEESVGCPIRSSMETVVVGKTARKSMPVHLDKYASQADWIIPIGRVKLHTDIKGPIQSGVCKMMVIGLGKQAGADLCHQRGWKEMSENIQEIAGEILKRANILCGIAILENCFHHTYRIEAIPADRILEEEPKLLEDARKQLHRIPFSKVDILICDWIGKDISGAGMDPNVTGRSSVNGISEPWIDKIIIRDLTENSHHNGTGCGNADVMPYSMFQKISLEATYPNSITSRDTNGFKIPVLMPNEHLCIRFAMHTTTDARADTGYRIMWIRDTNHLQEFYVSPLLAAEARNHPDMTVEPTRLAVRYDGQDNILGLFPVEDT